MFISSSFTDLCVKFIVSDVTSTSFISALDSLKRGKRLNSVTHWDIQVTGGGGGKLRVPLSSTACGCLVQATALLRSRYVIVRLLALLLIEPCHSWTSSLWVLVRVFRYYLTLLPTVVHCYPLYQLGPLEKYSFQWMLFALVDIGTCLWITWLSGLIAIRLYLNRILGLVDDLLTSYLYLRTSRTSLHLTRISGLLDVSFVLPNSQDSFNMMYPYIETSQYVNMSSS